MPLFQDFRKSWVRPALFFGNNPISLAGGAITTASCATMVSYWIVEYFGRLSENPYLGIIFFLILPVLFLVGLVLIPIGIVVRRRKLLAAGLIPAEFPRIDINDPVFRHGLDIVLVATIANLLIVAAASYRGAAYMDSPEFCGQSCHVMHPEYTAYKISAHSHVACAECHIGSGAEAFLSAKINGTKQLVEVATNRYPTPIPSPVTRLRPARYICESCHSPARFIGDKLLVKSSFDDNETNTASQTVLVLHVGGEDSLSRLSGIHGAHLGHVEYIATDPARATIPWVQRTNPDGTQSTYVASALKGAMPAGERRTMDCTDCHNRPAHSFQTAEDAINSAMANGAISPDLPWIHKEGLELLKADYASEADAAVKIPQRLNAYYGNLNPAVLATKSAQVKAAAEELVLIYSQNVFPDMKVTWGTHPNNLGHMAYPGCFRCHDGDHVAKNGTSITQDCAACHNLLAVQEAKPKVLSDLGI